MTLDWRRIHLHAALEARRAHQQLGIDTTRRIDPFVALEASGVVVMRQRLDGFAGMYIPADPAEGNAPGVLINAAHPLSRQRFTAAHELAHHRRDRQLVLDRETGWAARGDDRASDVERFAEAFAAWFLMPKALVEAALDALGLRASQLTPEGAYTLSLELGTSFDATVYHLADMQVITRAHANRLQKSTPQAIKRALGASDILADAWKDVWLIRPTRPAWSVGALEGDAVVVEVSETPSSGYRWLPAPVPVGLALVRDEYRVLDEHALGGRGVHRFLFRVEAPGQQELLLEMRRPWQRGTAAETLRIPITAVPRPTPGIVEPLTLLPAAA